MPRRKPDRVEVLRVELGGYERQQLADIKFAMAAPALGTAAAGIAVGVGLYYGAMFFNNTLDEVKDHLAETWSNLMRTWEFGADDVTIAALNANVTEEPAVEGPESMGHLSEWMDGLSPYSIYATFKTWEEGLTQMQYDLWRVAEGLEDIGSNWVWFKAHSPVVKWMKPRISDEPPNADAYSEFAYQIAIRETAARRDLGRKASNFTGIPIVGRIAWGIADIGNSGWTNDNVEDAPGYNSDRLLWSAWPRVVLMDGSASRLADNEPWIRDVNQGVAYEEMIYAGWMANQSDPKHLTPYWPGDDGGASRPPGAPRVDQPDDVTWRPTDEDDTQPGEYVFS